MAKEVLMSRRNAPMDHVDAASFSRSAGNSGTGGLTGYQPPPISNYKGVMLCDRPVPPAGKGQPTVLENGQQMPFSCSIGPLSKFEKLGLNPSREERAMRLAMDSKVQQKTNDDFFSKHKQWLAQLRKDKRRKAIEDEAEAANQEEKRRRFKEYSAKLRESIRQAKTEDTQHLTAENLAKHEKAASEKHSRAETPQKNAKGKKKGKAKPAWALTEAQTAAQEEEEVDDLLNFAAGLDYDKYIDDWEVRSALAAVKERIASLSHQKQQAESPVPAPATEDGAEVLPLEDDDWRRTFTHEWNREEAEAIIAAGKARSKASRAGSVAGSQVSAVSARTDASRMSAASNASAKSAAPSEGDTAYQTAERILHSSRGLRKVHSSHSVRAILEKKKAALERRAARLESVQEVEIATVDAPRIVEYSQHDQGGPLGTVKPPMDPSNLPYLHRNPAI